MSQILNWILIVLGAVLILVEVLLGAFAGFDFLLIGSAVLLGGVLGLLTKSPEIGIATAGLLSLVYVFVGRSRIRNRLRRPSIPSNTDALLGRIALVTEEIQPHRPGRVKLEGDEWRAESTPESPAILHIGAHVRVVRIEGVTAFVEPETTRTEGGT